MVLVHLWYDDGTGDGIRTFILLFVAGNPNGKENRRRRWSMEITLVLMSDSSGGWRWQRARDMTRDPLNDYSSLEFIWLGLP